MFLYIDEVLKFIWLSYSNFNIMFYCLFMVLIFLLVFEFNNLLSSMVMVMFFFFIFNQIFYNWGIFFLLLGGGCFYFLMKFYMKDSLDLLLLLLLNFFSLLYMMYSFNLFFLFISLEIQTFSMLMMICKNSKSIKSIESGLKYFILGSLSSSLYLLGLSFLLKNGYNLDLGNMNHLIFYQNFFGSGVLLIIISMLFKMAMFPFHFWLADIFEGSSYSIMFLLSSIPKMSLLIMLLKMTYYDEFIMNFSILSMFIGSMAGINQTKMKSLLAYSSMSHFGFMMLCLLFFNLLGYELLVLYLLVYMISIMSLFSLIFNSTINSFSFIMELYKLYNYNNYLSMFICLLILSLAGLPPLLGFIPKWFIIWKMMQSGFYLSSVIIIISSLLSIAFYLSLVNLMLFHNNNNILMWENILLFKPSYNYFSNLLISMFLYLMVFIIFHPIVLNLSVYWSSILLL